MTQIDRIDGGYATARLSSAEADKIARAEREAAALAWLTARGLGDVAVILGLVPEMCAGGCGAEAERNGWCMDRECRRATSRARVAASKAGAR